MFSVENLYYILYVNLFKRIKIDIEYFYKFGSIDINDMVRNFNTDDNYYNKACAYFFDQEPAKFETLENIWCRRLAQQKDVILVTSEHSEIVKNYCKKYNFYHLYYFFHGFASLDWYRDAEYFTIKHIVFKNRFLSLNRLCTKERSYRLLLVSKFIEKNIISKGSVSLQIIENDINIVKNELFDSSCKLSKESKIEIFKNLSSLKTNLVIDNEEVNGDSSSHFGPLEFRLWQSSFLHVVSETVFFDKKLHLTEKIFKPIVSQRPFILLGAYKNLEYLKSYGFKTFSNWIDESYDNEPDNEKRLVMVCDEVEKIANLSDHEIQTMYWDMQEVLEYNYRHFFTDFKRIIVEELVDNFEGYMRWYNHDRLYVDCYDIDSLNLSEVKRLLAK